MPDTTQPAEMKLFLLDEQIKGLDLEGLPTEMRDFVVSEGVERLHHPVRIGYEYFTAEAVLRRLLPEGLEVPSSFEQVGHVAHVNLRNEHLPYKELIGQARGSQALQRARAQQSASRTQVLLDKNTPRIRTIVNSRNRAIVNSRNRIIVDSLVRIITNSWVRIIVDSRIHTIVNSRNRIIANSRNRNIVVRGIE